MDKINSSRAFVFLLGALVVSLNSPMTMSASLKSGRAQKSQKSSALELREREVNALLARSDQPPDCSSSDISPILPPEQEIFRVVRAVKITPDDGKVYLGAFWSPKGNAAIFVVGTNEGRPIRDNDPLPSPDGESIRLFGVMKTQLILYSLASGTWKKITSDGLHPTWSRDGQRIYYLAGARLMRVEVDLKRIRPTGLRVPYTGVGLTLSRPFPDGRILAPRHPHTPLEVRGGTTPTPVQIGVGDGDVIHLSSQQDRVIVGYGATTVPAVTAIYDLLDGKITPLLRDCHASAGEMTWSATGSQIGYPVFAERSEIRIYDLESGQTQVPLRMDTFGHLSGLSWSPDGKYLAFAQENDHPGELPFSIWAVSTDGSARQQLVEEGILPNWSPDGKHLLYYARRGTDRWADWYLLEVSPAVQ